MKSNCRRHVRRACAAWAAVLILTGLPVAGAPGGTAPRVLAGLDRPIVIGKFHFGEIDSTILAPAMVRVANQADRAWAYPPTSRARCTNHLAVVDTHWFQSYDQPTTGRFDGESYNTGLLDTCDTSYLEMVAACREMVAAMYDLRARIERGASC